MNSRVYAYYLSYKYIFHLERIHYEQGTSPTVPRTMPVAADGSFNETWVWVDQTPANVSALHLLPGFPMKYS